MRERSPGRAPLEGAGDSAEGAAPGPVYSRTRARALSARNGPLPAGLRGGGIGRGVAAPRGGAAPLPPWPGRTSPGRGATPGRPGKAGLRPRRGGCRRRGRRNLTLDDRLLSGRHRAKLRDRLGGPARLYDARWRLLLQPAEGLRRQRRGAGKAACTAGGRATVRVPGATGRSRATGGAGEAAGGLLLWGSRRREPLSEAPRERPLQPAALAFGGAVCGLALSSTLRTRSAIWSGTTLSWFLASNIPPKRSLKSVVSSFEVSPTSLASSKIRTFPAKFPLECEALESHQLECAEPQPTARLR